MDVTNIPRKGYCILKHNQDGGVCVIDVYINNRLTGTGKVIRIDNLKQISLCGVKRTFTEMMND